MGKKNERTCPYNHVQNHAYASESRHMYVRGVRQLANPAPSLQCYFENPASIIACFPLFHTPFCISNFIKFRPTQSSEYENNGYFVKTFKFCFVQKTF